MAISLDPTTEAGSGKEIMTTNVLETSKSMIEYLARGVEFAAALIIGLAAIEATIKAVVLFAKRNAPPEQKNEVRLTLGRWLAVALEFELAADILNTAVTPTWNDIEKLAAIATLRTALNYFLEREIERESQPAQIRAEEKTTGAKENALTTHVSRSTEAE